MPLGPYPMYNSNLGWMKAWIIDKDYQPCYMPRGDLNLDIGIRQLIYNDAGVYQDSRALSYCEDDTLIEVRTCQEIYDMPTNKFAVQYTKDVYLSCDDIKKMIRTEVANWALYDETFVQEVAKINAKAQKSAARDQRMKRKAQAKAQVPKPSRAKRRLAFAGFAATGVTKRSKAPKKVHLVTKLDKAMQAQITSNKKIQKLLWAQKKLQSDKAFHKCLVENPLTLKLAGRMFEVMPNKDLVTIAKKLAKNCAQDCLEEILTSNRFAALEHNNAVFNAKCAEAVGINANLEKLTAQSLGPSAVGPKDVGPDVGPKDVGPNEDVGPKDMRTPKPQFDAQPHWVRSVRSSSGYKGVINDGKRGWRVKHGNSTLARFATVHEAAQYYYDYCEALKKLE